MFTNLDALTPETLERLSLSRDLKSAGAVINKETGEYEYHHKYIYSGTLEFYHETGMECVASIVHDNRGIHYGTDLSGNKTQFKSLSWSVFISGGEYLKVFKDSSIIWEGLLLKDAKTIKEKNYYFKNVF